MNKNKPKGVLDSEYYEERMTKKELVFRYKTRSRIVADSIKKYYKKNEDLKILDYGAAEGFALIELDRIMPGNTMIGVEYSEDLMSKAPELPTNIRLKQGDVSKLDDEIKSERYDVVVALALLEHLKDPLACMEQAKEVLKDGGLFIATSPSPMWDDISSKLGLLKDDQHEMDMSKKVFFDLANKSGLEVLEYNRFMWSPVSFLPYLGISVSPKLSLSIDYFIRKLFIFNFLFVNQIIILRKSK